MLGFEGMVTPLGKKNLRSILPEHLVIPSFFMYTNVEANVAAILVTQGKHDPDRKF